MRQVNKWKANGIEWPGGQSLEMGDLSLPLGCVITDKKTTICWEAPAICQTGYTMFMFHTKALNSIR